MNLEQFTGFLNNPGNLNGQSLPLLSDLVKEYPYFQTAQLLLAKNLNNEKNIRYNAQLKIAAAYSVDRKMLYELINGRPVVEEKPTVQPEIKQQQTVKPEEKKEEVVQSEKQEQKVIEKPEVILKPVEKPTEKKTVIEVKKEEKAEPVAEKPKQDEKHTFTEWLKLTSIHSVTATEIERETEKKKPASQSELIDKFIREEPKISKPKKTEFFSPVNMAKQSVVEDDDLVTETLATIYEKQGFYTKAIKAYEKLSLKYPEKKVSFAARIENLRQKLNEQ